MLIYAMSDIHGEREAFEDSLSVVDFSDPNTMLVLCGDYIDKAHLHPEFLTYIMEFQQVHEGQVVVLMGNHEAWVLENDVMTCDAAFSDSSDEVRYLDNPAFSILQDRKTSEWLFGLPLYYETDDQIFVHAGIDEEAGEFWRVGTEDYFFHSKYPQTYGAFPKDIIAGHIGTYSMCGENRVFWDGQSHFYLDGTTEESKLVPVLKRDPETGEYTSFKKIGFGDGVPRWWEYVVKPGRDKEEGRW